MVHFSVFFSNISYLSFQYDEKLIRILRYQEYKLYTCLTMKYRLRRSLLIASSLPSISFTYTTFTNNYENTLVTVNTYKIAIVAHNLPFHASNKFEYIYI